MNCSDGLDSVKAGVKPIFALAGGGSFEGDREGHQRLGLGRGILCVNETQCF